MEITWHKTAFFLKMLLNLINKLLHGSQYYLAQIRSIPQIKNEL